MDTLNYKNTNTFCVWHFYFNGTLVSGRSSLHGPDTVTSALLAHQFFSLPHFSPKWPLYL